MKNYSLNAQRRQLSECKAEKILERLWKFVLSQFAEFYDIVKPQIKQLLKNLEQQDKEAVAAFREISRASIEMMEGYLF